MKLSTVCNGLLQSVLGSLKPLLLDHTSFEARSLSPANERSAGLLLELALLTGVTVCIRAIYIVYMHARSVLHSLHVYCHIVVL